MLRDAEAAMCAWGQLAWVSHQKRQALARDRFLLLTGAAACEAGWLEVAAECYRLLTEFAPRHQLARFASFPDAMKVEGFRQLVAATMRNCPFERAEHLLSGLGRSSCGDNPEQSRGDWMRELLTRPEWHS